MSRSWSWTSLTTLVGQVAVQNGQGMARHIAEVMQAQGHASGDDSRGPPRSNAQTDRSCRPLESLLWIASLLTALACCCASCAAQWLTALPRLGLAAAHCLLPPRPQSLLPT